MSQDDTKEQSLCLKAHTLILPLELTICCCCCCQVASVVSDSVQPHRWHPTRLCRPWDSPSKNNGVGCHFLLQCMKVKSESEVTQSCRTLSDPMDCSPPGSSVHGIFQARVLEWDAIVFSRASWADEAKSSQTALEFFHSKLWQSGSPCMAQVEISF